jgi:hypothetical protein
MKAKATIWSCNKSTPEKNNRKKKLMSFLRGLKNKKINFRLKLIKLRPYNSKKPLNGKKL